MNHIDITKLNRHDTEVSFNRLTGFSRLNLPGRRTAYTVLCGIFTSVKSLPFSMVGRGLGGFVPADSGNQSANPNLLPATSMFSSIKVAFIDIPEKGFPMFNRKKSLRSVPVRIFKTREDANRHIDFLMITQANIRLNLFRSPKGWELRQL